MAGLANAPRQFASLWARIDINQKVSILLVGLGSVAAIVALVVWSGRPSYGLLYSNLSRKDAAAVVAQLESDGIAHRLDDNGTAVLVPADQVETARAKLLTQGIPAGGDGFEILDKSAIGMTNFAERKTFLRAVQGELARTISRVEPVEWARVHINAPEPSVFLDRERPASASVLVKLRPGTQLAPPQVASIAAFVARSVEGLEPKNVTITDQLLNPLSQAVHDDGPGSATAHLEAQHQIERHLEKKVREMLEATLGAGRASVSVCADIQLKQEETRSTEYEAEGRVAKLEKSTTTKKTKGEGDRGGTVGVDAALGGSSTTSGGTGGTESTVDETMEYQVPVRELHSVDHGVLVKRLTVSVLVAGGRKVETNAEGEETQTFVPLPSDEMTKLEEAVKQAVGYDETRSDIVKVECVAFNEPQPVVTEAELASEQRWAMMLRLAKHGSTVVVVAAFLLVMRSMAKRARAAREAAEVEARQTIAAQAAASAPAPQPLRERVASAVHSDPDGAAEVLKSWYTAGGTPPAPTPEHADEAVPAQTM